MIKKIIFFLLSFSVLFGVAFGLHHYVLSTSKMVIRFSLLQVYVFHFVFSLIISTLFLLLSNSHKWFSQLGVLYIFTMINKGLFFALVFKDSIFKIDKYTKTESLSLIIPLFLFLFMEVYFIANILNKK